VSVELTAATPAGRADHAAASQRQAARTGPADACAAEEIMELLPRLPVWQDWDARRRAQARRGAAAILRWLAAFPGAGWQQRWLAAGADAGLDWLHAVPLGGGQPPGPVSQRETSRNGLAGLLLCRAVLPGCQLLAGYQAQTLFADARRVIQPDTFAEITGHAAAAGMPRHRAHAGLTVITKLALHTGRDVTKLSFGDFEEYRAWGRQRYGCNSPAILPAWDLLRGIGAGSPVLSYRAMLARDRQRPAAELADRCQIRCAPVRDALIRYLGERRPGMDCKSFLNLIAMLAGLFWADIEARHPGISSLHLPADVAAAWKQRLQYCTGRDGQQRPRKEYLPVLMQVRSFYLDIQEWAVQDPTWAAHAVPSPVRRGGNRGLGQAAAPRQRRDAPADPGTAPAAAHPGRGGRVAPRRSAGPARRRDRHTGRGSVRARRDPLPAHPPEDSRQAQHNPGAWCRARRGQRNRAGHRRHPGRGRGLLGVGDHRDAAAHRRPARRTPRDQPARADLLPAARHR
jgi:hypothetical protein